MNKILAKAQPGRKNEFSKFEKPLLSLEEIYLNTKIKHLTGISHWTDVEKIGICYTLGTTADLKDIDQLVGLEKNFDPKFTSKIGPKFPPKIYPKISKIGQRFRPKN